MELFVIIFNSVADHMRRSEIKRRPLNRTNLTGRNAEGVNRRKGIGINCKLMTENIAGIKSAEIKIRMICQIDDCFFCRKQPNIQASVHSDRLNCIEPAHSAFPGSR